MTTTPSTLLPAAEISSETAPQTSLNLDADLRGTDSRPRRTWLAASVAAATAALQACGGGGEESPTISSLSAGSGESVPPNASSNLARSATSTAGAAVISSATAAGGTAGPLAKSRTFVTPRQDSDAARLLLQAQFSASDAEIASVRSLGYAGWVATQLSAAPGVTAWDWLNQRGYGKLDSNAYHFLPYPIDFAMWYQLIKSPDGMRKRVALALSEIFSVSTYGVGYMWTCHAMASWWDMLSANAFGNFRTLLENVALHPAMGMYLNIRGSQKENAAGRQPDENFAREVMQLMTIGLVKLNQDGTPVVSGGVPVETYTQEDVVNLARVFSGYDFNEKTAPPTYFNGLSVPHMNFTRQPMVLNPALHSTLAVKFLGAQIPAGTDGNAARKTALDTLFNHPNVGPFIGRQLIQRLVTSNPSPAYVARVSAAFADNGKGVRGELSAVIAAVLLDDEARDPAGLTSKTFGHVREPMVRMVQWARSFGLNSAYGSWKLYDQSLPTQLGQSPLRAPSIFNFFRPSYTPPASSIAAAGLVAPEFQMVTESTVSAYVNYMQTCVRNGFYVGAPNLPQITGNATNGFDISPSYTNELAIVADASALVNRINLVMAAGQLSAGTVAVIVQALNANPVTAKSNNDVKLNRIASAVLLVMASYEYLVQK